MKFDIKQFDTAECVIKKSKWHYIEFDNEFFHYRANYLSEQKIEEQWQECWRFWDECHYKRAVCAFGFYRATLVESDSVESIWEYKISLLGNNDGVLLPFDSKDDIIRFHELFKKYMNAS